MRNEFKVKCLVTQTINISTGRQITMLSHARFGISEIQLQFANEMSRSVEYSEKTLTTYISNINTYIKSLYYFEDIKDLTIDEAILLAGVFQVNNFLYELRKRKYSDQYIVLVDAALKTFYNWTDVNRALFSRIVEEFKSPYYDNKSKALGSYYRRVEHVSCEELIILLKYKPKDEGFNCALHLMFDTGVRISELLKFKVKHFKNIEIPPKPCWLEIDVMGSKKRGGGIQKGKTDISSYVLERVKNLIKSNSLIDDEQFVFVDSRKNVIKQNSLQRKINRTSTKLRAAKKLDKNITAHMFRHGTAFSIMQFTAGLNTFENLIQVKQILRHKSILSLEPYTNVNYPVILRAREHSLALGIQSRLDEAKYIYEHSLKPN